MTIKFNKLSNFDPCIIAEMACGHDGSFKKLKNLIAIAQKSGAKAIKFQIYFEPPLDVLFEWTKHVPNFYP